MLWQRDASTYNSEFDSTNMPTGFFGDMDPGSNETMGMKMYFYYGATVDNILWEQWQALTPESFAGAIAAVFVMAFVNQLVFFFMNQPIMKR
jgi:hypothetical protein